MTERANMRLKDAGLINADALPNGATTVNGTAFDLGAISDRGAFLADCELEISAPALTTSELPDSQTMTYDVQASTTSDFSSGNKDLGKGVLVQTGAGGAGAAAAVERFRLPSNCPRYVRINATNSGAGNASGKSMTNSLCF